MSNAKFVLRTIVLSLAGSVLVFVGVGQVLASEWTVSTTRVIPVSAQQVSAPVVDMNRWADWIALEFPLGNPTTREVRGEPGQAGQQILWSGPLGKAAVTLDAVTADGVDYRIQYGFGSGEEEGTFRAGGKFLGSIQWQADGDGVAVTWSEHGEMGSLIERWSNWFGALQDKVHQIQRASLESLAQHLDAVEAAEGR